LDHRAAPGGKLRQERPEEIEVREFYSKVSRKRQVVMLMDGKIHLVTVKPGPYPKKRRPGREEAA